MHGKFRCGSYGRAWRYWLALFDRLTGDLKGVLCARVVTFIAALITLFVNGREVTTPPFCTGHIGSPILAVVGIKPLMILASGSRQKLFVPTRVHGINFLGRLIIPCCLPRPDRR